MERVQQVPNKRAKGGHDSPKSKNRVDSVGTFKQ